MIRRLSMVAALIAAPILASASEEVVAGLSQDRVEITANFEGSDILIYGAVKRETPIPTSAPLQVIITVEGPASEQKVRRKSRHFGIWVNTDQVVVDSAPSFYAVATTAPLDEIISDTEDLRRSISIPRAIRSVGAPQNVADPEAFRDALIRLREANGLYSLREGSVNLVDQTLFRTNVDLPANLVEGIYKTRIFLLRDKKMVNVYQKTMYVRKVGLERWLANTAVQQSEFYGILSLLIAGFAGWAAAAVFRFIRT